MKYRRQKTQPAIDARKKTAAGSFVRAQPTNEEKWHSKYMQILTFSEAGKVWTLRSDDQYAPIQIQIAHAVM